MKTTKTKTMLLLLLCLTLLFTNALALNNTHDNLESAGFTPVEKTGYQNYYTLLNIPGYDYPVLAFESAEEGTQFRIYGKIGKVEGYYPVKVEVADVGTDAERYVITVTDTVPAKNDKKMLAKLTVVPYTEIPEGCVALDKKGTAVKLQNIFGQTETYVFGTYDTQDNPEAVFGWYKSENAKAIAGGLRYDLEDAKLRVKPADVKKRALPKEMKKGFSQNVMFTCSNGFTVTNKTFYPEIDYTTLQEEVKEEQRTKTGTFTETETEEIPYETEVRKNKNLYVTEENVLQEGVNGIREITYKVNYKNGEETKRTKSGTKVIQKPVKEIIERGTKEPDEAYVFSNNMTIDVTVSNASPVEGDSFTADCTISGKKPEGGYTATLTAYDGNGAVVAQTTAKNMKPGKVTCRNLTPGTYKIVAEATAANGEIIRASQYVSVSAKAVETVTPVPTEGPSAEVTETVIVTVAPKAEETANTNKDVKPTDAPKATEKPTVTPTAVPTATPAPVITSKTVTESETIPYSTERLTDPNMFVDAGEVVVRNGIAGKKVITYEVTYQDGVQISKEKLSEVVSVQPISKQVKTGTKEHVTETKTETKTEAIAIETVYVDDNSKYTDDPQEVINSGAAGERTLTYKVTYLDGKETKREKVSETITREMVKAQVKRGTKQHVITTEDVVNTETIPYPIDYIETDQLEVGVEVYSGDGINGEKDVTYRITYTDGQETKREKVSETVTKQPVKDTCIKGTFVPTFDYETVSISLSGMHGTRSGSLDATCQGQAMSMAKNGVAHSGNGSLESVGGWDSLSSAEAGLVSHVPALATREYWGAGCVKVTKHWADGSTTNHYYACAEGSGEIMEQDVNGNWTTWAQRQTQQTESIEETKLPVTEESISEQPTQEDAETNEQ